MLQYAYKQDPQGKNFQEFNKPTTTEIESQTTPTTYLWERSGHINYLENSAKKQSQNLPDSNKTNQGDLFTEQ